MTQDVDQLFGLGGKTALVTGASRGIGRAIALAYADAGADVALLARGVDNLEAVAEEVRQRGRRALVLACDVHEPDQVEDSVRRAAEELGPLDIVVNNAGGITSAGPFLESSQEQWQREMRLNFDSVLQVCRIVGGAMTVRGRGSIINMSSIAGESGLPNFSPYAVAKAAVTALTHSLAAEWANSGVRVNAITAGWLHTDLTDVLVTDEELSGRLLDVVPMGRFGTPQDMVGLAVYLAGDASRFMTGTAVVIDGGVSSFYGGSAMLRPPGNELVSTVSGSGP